MKDSEKSTFSVKQHLTNLVIVFFLGLLVLVVLQQANPLTTKLGRDSGIYIYVSNTFLNDEIPYVGAMETKPPGIFFVNAFALWVGKGTRWGIWLVEFFFLFASVCIGFYLLRYKFGFGPALVASAVWLTGLNSTLEGGNLTEEYSLLFGFCALLLWILSEKESKIFLFDIGIGLCAGLSALLRPNNVGVQFSIVLTIILLHSLRKDFIALFFRLIVIIVAAIIPWLIVGFYFQLHGAFSGFLEASFVYNMSYIGEDLNVRSALLAGVNYLGFSFGFALIGYFVIAGQLRQQIASKNFTPFFLWIIINGVLEVLLSSLSGRNYQHYFICWLPVISSAVASLVFFVFPLFCQWIEKYSLGFVMISIGFVFLLFPNLSFDYANSAKRLLFHRDQGVQYADPVVEYVNWRTASGDFVLVWGGQAGINFLSNRDAPTPYIFYPLFFQSEITDRMSEDYYRSIQKTPPKLIVDGSSFSMNIVPLNEGYPLKWLIDRDIYAPPNLMEVLTFIAKNYSLDNVINGVKIYKLKN